jgi:hypothetical protein
LLAAFALTLLAPAVAIVAVVGLRDIGLPGLQIVLTGATALMLFEFARSVLKVCAAKRNNQ